MFRTPLAGLLLVAACLSPAVADTHSQTAIKAFNDGVAFLNNGDYQNAVGHFDDAIAADNEFAEAYYVRAVCRYSLKMPENAQADLGEAIRLKPDLYDAYALRGVMAYEAEQYDQAYADVNTVLQHKPDDAQSLLVRAIIELKREDLASSKRDFKAFIKLRPNDSMAPKVREVLGQMDQVAASEEETPAPNKKAPARHATRSTSPSPTPMLTARALADKFGRQLMRGDRGPVTGDIDQRTTVESSQ